MLWNMKITDHIKIKEKVGSHMISYTKEIYSVETEIGWVWDNS